MSLYNLLFGENPASDVLLTILETSKNDIPRYRDVYISNENDEPRIVIHTRTGGGNREYYDEPNEENTEGPWNSTLRALPGFEKDYDDDFDATYASFVFKVPDQYWRLVKKLQESFNNETPSEKWKELFDELERTRKGR